MLLSEQDPARIAAFADADQAGDPRADQFRQARDRADRLDRPDHLDQLAEHRRGHGQGRRTRHAPGQALRRRPDRAVPAGLPLASAPTGCSSNPTFAAPSSARNSRSSTSRSCGWRTARSPASRRCCAGIIRGAASIPPSDFIPVAESCGLIVQLGLFAMQRAADDLAGWQKQIGDMPLSVSVNLSSRAADPPRPRQRRALGDRAREPASRAASGWS